MKDHNVFSILPPGFFNLLAGGSNQELYSACLLLIYEQFEREISYRVDRRQIRDVLADKKKSEEETKEVISNISHDLRTPITSIKGYVEGIMDGVADTPEKMDRYIKTIYSKANDMDHLISELTLYSRLDTNSIPYNYHMLNVCEYFDDGALDIGLELA